MIKDRPDYLHANASYGKLPPLPYAVDWGSIPELVRASMLDLGGIQPVTRAMADAAAGPLRDMPSRGEIALFRDSGTQFQLISLVASLLPAGLHDGHFLGTPFALTLIPASKRGEVTHCTIDLIEKLDVPEWLKTEPSYAGYDPFSGEWSIYGALNLLVTRGLATGFLDEIGLVIDQFFLATNFDMDDVLVADIGFPLDKLETKYKQHRSALLFTPFEQVRARRVWGVESPIELFMLQALANNGLFPQIQMLILEDGSLFPSWYHLWRDVEFRHLPGLVTEADFFFPVQRVAVFCDGNHHRRRRQREKDEAINRKLESLGIRPVRIAGRQIVRDLGSALERVLQAIA